MAVVANTALGPSQPGPHSDGRGPSLKGPAIFAAGPVPALRGVSVHDERRRSAGRDDQAVMPSTTLSSLRIGSRE